MKRKKIAPISAMLHWLKDGNDCSKCVAAWSTYSAGCDEWDGGCCADRKEGVGWEPCRLPWLLRWYRTRRYRYFAAHEYDDCDVYYKATEAKDKAVLEVMAKELSEGYRVIAWKNPENGELIEYDDDDILYRIAWKARSAVDDYEREHAPKTLSAEWHALFKKTYKRLLFKVKSYLCAG